MELKPKKPQLFFLLFMKFKPSMFLMQNCKINKFELKWVINKSELFEFDYTISEWKININYNL